MVVPRQLHRPQLLRSWPIRPYRHTTMWAITAQAIWAIDGFKDNHIGGSMSASPGACLPPGYSRAGTQNDRLGESFPTVRATCPAHVKVVRPTRMPTRMSAHTGHIGHRRPPRHSFVDCHCHQDPSWRSCTSRAGDGPQASRALWPRSVCERRDDQRCDQRHIPLWVGRGGGGRRRAFVREAGCVSAVRT